MKRLLCIFIVAGCHSADDLPEEQSYQCITYPQVASFTQNKLTAVFPEDIIERLAISNLPDEQGAMDRNMDGYFHVRFQMGILPVTDFALRAGRVDMLENAVRAIEYSFSHQLSSGDFELIVPEELSSPVPASESDKVSATAFFMSSVGSALLGMQESSWYHQQEAFTSRIEQLHSSFVSALKFLKSQQLLLKETDAEAPNRLLFDAVAFYSFGKYLNDDEAVALGLQFARMALDQQHSNGYFLEKDGWDSSYQAVALENGFRLLTLLEANDPLAAGLYHSLSCGTDWEASRVEEDGEIITDGNTRVYDGGESFLGAEKGMAWKSAVVAFLSLYHFSGDDSFMQKAENVLNYYE